MLTPTPVMHVCGTCPTLFSSKTFPQPEKEIGGWYVRFHCATRSIVLPRISSPPALYCAGLPPSALSPLHLPATKNALGRMLLEECNTQPAIFVVATTISPLLEECNSTQASARERIRGASPAAVDLRVQKLRVCAREPNGVLADAEHGAVLHRDLRDGAGGDALGPAVRDGQAVQPHVRHVPCRPTKTR